MAFSIARCPWWRYGLLATLTLLLTGCFEIQEEIILNKDGSGQFRMLVDLSKQRETIQAMAMEAATQGQSTFGKGDLPFEELVLAWSGGAAHINNINGISNATPIVDRDAYIFGWSFDFADIHSLNLVLALKDDATYNPDYQPSYSFQKNTLVKHNIFAFRKLLYHLEENEEDSLSDMLKTQKKAIFAGIRYQCSIIVAKGKIKKHKNNFFTLSADKRRLYYNALLSDINAGIANIGTEVKFKFK